MLAAISPLFTLAALWQMKEWRWDRLREHIDKEGVIRQLVGTSRIVVLCAYLALIVSLLTFMHPSDMLLGSVSIATLSTLTLIGAAQWITKKQRTPRWTAKAAIIVSGSLMLFSATLLAIISGEALVLTPLLPYGMPLFLFLSWAAFLPIDRKMKQRMFARAESIRTSHPHLTVIGITGSVGKTTTKELLAHLLRDRHPLVTPAHVNTDTGVSQWLTQELASLPQEEKRIVIVEMGAYRRGEIELLASIVQPSIGIITRIGEEHLALFGSREAIMQAKGELFVALPQDGHAFINADDTAAPTLRSYCQCNVTTVSTGTDGDMRAVSIEEAERSVRFSVEGQTMTLPVPGTHNISNAILAIACAHHLGMSMKAIAEKLQSFSLQDHTFNVTQERGVTVLDATYNSSPQSVQAAIRWARAQPHREKIVLMSGIIELGTEEEAIHQSLAKELCTVFSQAYVLSERFRKPLAEGGFGSRVSIIEKHPQKLREGTLFVCIGRMPSATIRSLLP